MTRPPMHDRDTATPRIDHRPDADTSGISIALKPIQIRRLQAEAGTEAMKASG